MKKTGDDVIDSVLQKLSLLEKKGGRISEAELVDTLKPLFSRSAFYDISQDNWNLFLFPLCRTRLILDQYKPYFRTHKEIRDAIHQVVQEMAQLEREVAKIFVPGFSITDHINRYRDDKGEFTNNLPSHAIRGNDYHGFMEIRNKTINKIREILLPVGFVDMV
jgi:hypothetical protein